MRAIERHDHPIAPHLIVIGANPIETAIDGNIPRITKTTGDDFQIVTAVIASQHSAVESPVICGIVIRTAISVFAEVQGSREVGHIRRRCQSP